MEKYLKTRRERQIRTDYTMRQRYTRHIYKKTLQSRKRLATKNYPDVQMKNKIKKLEPEK